MESVPTPVQIGKPCPCPKKKGEYHDDCDRCITCHGRKNKLPYCQRKK